MPKKKTVTAAALRDEIEQMNAARAELEAKRSDIVAAINESKAQLKGVEKEMKALRDDKAPWVVEI